VTAPRGGVWRVGRTQEPIDFPDPPAGENLEYPHAGNRFDSPTEDFSTCYFATDLRACFGETLARYRPNPRLAEAATEAGFMGVGQVPADWRHQRVAIQVDFKPSVSRPQTRFLDVEALETREHLRNALAPILAYYRCSDLDVATVRGGDRRITRWIGKWTFEARDENGDPAYAGIRYLSRLNTDWECWAVFHDASIAETARMPIMRQNPDLRSIAKTFGLTVF
jgi:hypothetical protein